MMRVTLCLLLLCLSTVSLFSLNAKSGAPLPADRSAGLSLSPFFSAMTGFSDELVFDSSSDPYPYMSRLHWEIRPALIAGLSGSINIGNVLFFNAAAGSTLNASTGEMTDHDWLKNYFDLVDTGWTHYSLSDIFLTRSLLVDYNTAFRVYGSRSLNLELMAGFKLIQWGWTDTIREIDYPGSGSYDYLSGSSGIDYDIEYRIPYLGAGIVLKEGHFGGGLTFKFSWMVSADDHDFHKLRNLHFYDSFRDGRYYGLSMYGRWHWSPVFSLALSLDFDYVPVIQGDTVTGSSSGTFLGYYPGGAGVGYMTAAATLALEYNY